MASVQNCLPGGQRHALGVGPYHCAMRRATSSFEELETKLDLVIANKLSRQDAAEWAKSQGGGYGEQNPYGEDEKSGIGWAALTAMKALMSQDWESPSYFVRQHDLTEWRAVLRQENWTDQSVVGITVKRFHQLKHRITHEWAGDLAISPDDVAKRIGIHDFRGCDDLGPYKWVLFDDHKGRETLLEWREHPEIPGATVMVERDSNLDDTLQSVVRLLGLTNEAIIGRP